MEINLLIIVATLLGLILVTLWLVLYQLVKQQGRMLLRMDFIEQSLGLSGHPAQLHQSGFTVGTSLSLELPDLTGQKINLKQFLGKQIFLVNWNPNCGYCDRIAPDLAKLQADLEKHNVQMVFMSLGDAEDNLSLAEEHGFKCPILLLDSDSKDVNVFEGIGTPAAYLIDEKGAVAQSLVIGADDVPALARKSAHVEPKKLPSRRDLSKSRIERKGLKPGTPAPDFSLPDLHRGMVTLKEYRGQQVFLIFTDPHCGPCDQIASHLVLLYQQYRDENIALVMIGRGDPEENRQKAEKFGFEFPVGLQKRWEISKEYGIFAMPVAFLIDEEGVIARNVAQGVDEILALARQGSAARMEDGDARAVR